jgi:hypothetical protein
MRGFDGIASIVKRDLGERRNLGKRLRQFKSRLFQFVATHQVTLSSAQVGGVVCSFGVSGPVVDELDDRTVRISSPIRR